MEEVVEGILTELTEEKSATIKIDEPRFDGDNCQRSMVFGEHHLPELNDLMGKRVRARYDAIAELVSIEEIAKEE